MPSIQGLVGINPQVADVGFEESVQSAANTSRIEKSPRKEDSTVPERTVVADPPRIRSSVTKRVYRAKQTEEFQVFKKHDSASFGTNPHTSSPVRQPVQLMRSRQEGQVVHKAPKPNREPIPPKTAPPAVRGRRDAQRELASKMSRPALERPQVPEGRGKVRSEDLLESLGKNVEGLQVVRGSNTKGRVHTEKDREEVAEQLSDLRRQRDELLDQLRNSNSVSIEELRSKVLTMRSTLPRPIQA